MSDATSLTSDELCPHGNSRGMCGNPACFPFNAGIGQPGIEPITKETGCCMSDAVSSDELTPWREREIVMVPSLVQTLKALTPGDFVHCGTRWSYGVIRETASKLGISIGTKRTEKGITVFIMPTIPEPA